MRINFYNDKGSVRLLFSFIFSAILLMLFCITGCSETPVGSSMLTPDDIDRYTISKDGNVICIRDAYDSACVTLLPEDRNLIGIGKAPIIYIYPERLTYIFYREDEPILRAERLIDTTDILLGLKGKDAGGNGKNGGDGGNGGSEGDNNGRNSNGDNGDDSTLGPNNPQETHPLGLKGEDTGGNGKNVGDGGKGGSEGDNNGRNSNDDNGDEGTLGPNNPQETHPPRINNPSAASDGWIITIYYPDRSHLPTKLAHSGLTIKINEKQIGDGDIKDFSIFTNSESEQGIRFVYPVGSIEFSGLRIEITGLANTQEIVKFDLEPPVETS